MRFTGKVVCGLRQNAEGTVIGSVTNQHATQQFLSVQAEQEFLVDALEGVFECQLIRFVITQFIVTEAGNVDSHQFQLGGQIGAVKLTIIAAQVGRHDFGHFPARSHQAVHHPAVQRTLTHGKDIGITGLQPIIDANSASFSQLQPGILRQIIPRTHTGRHDDHVAVE